MKKFKLSKFLILFLSVALFFEIAPLEDVRAVPATQYNRSVREMMARRHKASSGFWRSSEVDEPKVSTTHIGGSLSSARTSITTTTYEQGSSYSKVSSPSLSLASLFKTSDKDGSLFPGGPCRNCHKSGPIFPGGVCKNCHKSGPIFLGGSCKRCLESGPLIDTGPCKNCKEPEPKVEEKPRPILAPTPQPKYVINEYIVQALAKNCCDMAPIYLEHVDFNLFADEDGITKNKMGNYRFRIFGCRRYDKEAILNHGRLLEKNMHFSEIFENVTGDCYDIVPMPQDICLQTEPVKMPEYILTAEITNFFMNVCDGYDYENSAPTNKRSGTSEMTVRWKLTNPSKTKIVWEGETTGYADLNLGQFEGEIALVHAAFADATENLMAARGFEDQLMVRLTPEELAAERDALIDEEAVLNPAKCRYAKELYQAQQCELTREDADIYNCPAVQEAIEKEACPVEAEVAACDCEKCSATLPCDAEVTPCEGENCPETLPCDEKVAACDCENCPEALPNDLGTLVCEGENCLEALSNNLGTLVCEGENCLETLPCDNELVLCEGEDCVQTMTPEDGSVSCDGGVQSKTLTNEAELVLCEGEDCVETIKPEDEPIYCNGGVYSKTLMSDGKPVFCDGENCVETLPCDEDLISQDGGVRSERSMHQVDPAPCEDGGACGIPLPVEEPAPCDGGACDAPLPVEEPAPCDGGACDAPAPVEEPAPCDGGACGVPAPVEETPVIEESSSIETNHDYKVLDNCIDENGDVISGGDCVVVDDTWVETDSKEEALESLCITARKPYDVLTAENIYKIRASVVEISNMAGKKGSGLIVSDEFVLTSADLVDNENNINKVRTINGQEFTGRAVRVNPSKNTALLMLDTKTQYSPLSLGLDLPKPGETGLLALGMLDVEKFDNGTENYLESNGKVLGYRYSDDRGSEIIVDTRVQDLVIGSVLIDSHGSVVGVAHTGQKTDSGKDLFLPTETALRSVGLTICDYVYEQPSPFRQTVYKPVTELILHSDPKAPELLKKKERK